MAVRNERSVVAAREARLGPGGAAWVDVVDVAPGEVAAVVEVEAGRSIAAFEWYGARAHARAAGDPVPAGTTLIALDGVRPDRPTLAWAAGALPVGGRLTVVADNPWSPLRGIDLWRGRPAVAAGVGLGGLSGLRRALASAGFTVERRFGLLRSSAAPVTAFDLDCPRAAADVLVAAKTHVVDTRSGGLDLLRWLAERGRAAAMAPAWLVIARRGPPAPLDQLRATGRIGFLRSEEVKVLRGEPPSALDTRYRTDEEANAAAAALTTLTDAGLAVAPRLLARPRPRVVRVSWLPGATLPLMRLAPEEVEQWLVRAARVLAAVQHATRRDDGSVLVHGDFWLGNVLVDDGEISGVIDWATASRGDAATDPDYLVDCTAAFCRLDPGAVARVRAAVAGIMGAAAPRA